MRTFLRRPRYGVLQSKENWRHQLQSKSWNFSLQARIHFHMVILSQISFSSNYVHLELKLFFILIVIQFSLQIFLLYTSSQTPLHSTPFLFFSFLFFPFLSFPFLLFFSFFLFSFFPLSLHIFLSLFLHGTEYHTSIQFNSILFYFFLSITIRFLLYITVQQSVFL